MIAGGAGVVGGGTDVVVEVILRGGVGGEVFGHWRPGEAEPALGSVRI